MTIEPIQRKENFTTALRYEWFTYMRFDFQFPNDSASRYILYVETDKGRCVAREKVITIFNH